LGKNAQYEECKVFIDAMAYADNVEEYEKNWDVIILNKNINLQCRMLKYGTQSDIYGHMHGRIGILIMGQRRTLWQSRRMQRI
jgi:hypothetical protein